MSSWTDAQRIERKRTDLERIRDDDAWPRHPYLPLKTQPWVNEKEGQMRFGLATDTLRDVLPTETILYASLEELVETWSVD